MEEKARQRFIISLGSNTQANEYIPYALSVLRSNLCIDKETELMQTKPVDFPYPSSDFTNVILWGETELSLDEVYKLLRSLEDYAGRRRTTPHLVPLDADLLVWEREVLKPQDLKRPYMKELISEL